MLAGARIPPSRPTDGGSPSPATATRTAASITGTRLLRQRAVHHGRRRLESAPPNSHPRPQRALHLLAAQRDGERLPARQAIPERPIQHGHASERRRELPATGARPPTAGSQVCSSRLAAGRRSGTGWPAGRHGVAGTGWTGWASGAAGPPDASGAPGATNVVVRLGAPVTIEAPDPQNLTASCEPGERALGGGVAPQSAVNEEVRIICSTPMRGGSIAANGDIPDGWRTRVGIIGAGADAAIPRVVCASP
jgi:hypothetical protein